MSIELPKARTDPEARLGAARGGRGRLRTLLGASGALILGLALAAYGRERLRSTRAPQYQTVLVETGDLPLFVVEGGAVISSNNETMKCKVEAMTGLVGGQNQAQGKGRAGASANGQAGAAGDTSAAVSAAAASASGSGGASGAASARTSATGSAAAGSASKSAGSASASASSASGGGGGGGGSGGGGSGGGGSSVPIRPKITSFTMTVAKYVPAKSTRTATNQSAASKNKAALQQQGQNGGNGGSGDQQEKAGATRIIKLLPEGTPVKAGTTVVTLDSATFRDEISAQQIKYVQAKANVEQVKAQLLVNQIALKEYEEGTLKQDRERIQQYLESCRTNLDQSRMTYEWSLGAVKIGLLSAPQARADEFDKQRAELALREAEGMQRRLEDFSAPKIVKTIKAKLQAIQADVYAQEVAFELENARLKKLKLMVENCDMKAPRDGVVVYHKESNGWGQSSNRVEEGATVREGQPLISLPDPTRMAIQVKVNESRIAQLHVDQEAFIRVDAFPGRQFRGHVSEVRAISNSANGPFSDVRIYDVIVAIDGGLFDGLRPGLGAEVAFAKSVRTGVTLVPIRSLRQVGSSLYAAVATPAGHAWRPVTVGAENPQFAEVLSGLKPGERVVGDPSGLPPPGAGKG